MGTVGYLLDTCTFLWAVRYPTKLSAIAKEVLEETNNKLFVSAVSAYEITNKYRLGKLQGYEDIAKNYFEVFCKLEADELLISMRHTHYAGSFEWEHRDPFDRLLVAQAFKENLTLITNDPEITKLPWVNVLW